MELRQEIFVITEVCIPVINANDRSYRGLDYSSSQSRDIYNSVKAELDGVVH